jgi:predicted hydrocarbon binding protein
MTALKAVPFYETDYFIHDLAHGKLANRSGTKMCYLPSEMLLALQQVLAEETGPEWRAILLRVGRLWGRRVARRFQRELTDYYARPLHEMPMAELKTILEGYFRYHGWGRLTLDFSIGEQGFILATLDQSAFVEIVGQSEFPIDSIVSGLLAEFFCQLSDRTDLQCIETECSAMGHLHCRFIIGTESRLAPVIRYVEEGEPHLQIVNRLTGVVADVH